MLVTSKGKPNRRRHIEVGTEVIVDKECSGKESQYSIKRHKIPAGYYTVVVAEAYIGVGPEGHRYHIYQIATEHGLLWVWAYDIVNVWCWIATNGNKVLS